MSTIRRCKGILPTGKRCPTIVEYKPRRGPLGGVLIKPDLWKYCIRHKRQCPTVINKHHRMMSRRTSQLERDAAKWRKYQRSCLRS